METHLFDDLPLFGTNSLWHLDADSNGDLSDIIFHLHGDFDAAELPIPSSDSIGSSPSVEGYPLIFPSQSMDRCEEDFRSYLWEDIGSCSSSSSDLSPAPPIAPSSNNCYSTSSLSSKKRSVAAALHSKMEPLALPKRQRSSEKEMPPSIDQSRGMNGYQVDREAVAKMTKEMIYRAAVMRPVNLGREVAEEKPRRRNVRVSSDPQTVAARRRRERLSERLRVLRRLVPCGSKMDTATMLEEAASYLKYLKSQISAEERERSSSLSRIRFGF